jgi:rhodanese-related sulfurtransferase
VGSSVSDPVENVTVTEVWSRLASDPASVLIDVRTKAEWTYVGVPDLSRIGKSPVFVEWQSYPDNRVDPEFGDRLTSLLDEKRTRTDDELFFLCRSGVRSLSAARAMTTRGYGRCRNVAEGFEGPLDDERHRGRTSGWKFAGLPWVQA